MTQLFANPYNICANGFYFSTIEEYNEQAKQCVDLYGQPVEEFELEFIDGDEIDCHLFTAWSVHQGNFQTFFDAVDALDEHEKIALIAMNECGYTIDENTSTDDVTIYYCESMKDLAIQFIEDGLFGEIPESIQNYIDHDAIARDLEFDYSELKIAGQRIFFRCP